MEEKRMSDYVLEHLPGFLAVVLKDEKFTTSEVVDWILAEVPEPRPSGARAAIATSVRKQLAQAVSRGEIILVTPSTGSRVSSVWRKLGEGAAQESSVSSPTKPKKIYKVLLVGGQSAYVSALKKKFLSLGLDIVQHWDRPGTLTLSPSIEGVVIFSNLSAMINVKDIVRKCREQGIPCLQMTPQVSQHLASLQQLFPQPESEKEPEVKKVFDISGRRTKLEPLVEVPVPMMGVSTPPTVAPAKMEQLKAEVEAKRQESLGPYERMMEARARLLDPSRKEKAQEGLRKAQEALKKAQEDLELARMEAEDIEKKVKDEMDKAMADWAKAGYPLAK